MLTPNTQNVGGPTCVGGHKCVGVNTCKCVLEVLYSCVGGHVFMCYMYPQCWRSHVLGVMISLLGS